MHINRGLLFWGLALVTAGAVALAEQQGYLDRDLLADAWRLWPLILVAIGLSIILARTPFAALGTIVAALVLGVAAGALIAVGPGVAVNCGGDEPTDLVARSGAFGEAVASVRLDFDCGSLELGMTDGDGWGTRTGVAGNREVRLTADADELTIRSPEGSIGFGEGRQRWEVELGSGPSYDLQVSANAADTTLDLAAGEFSTLRLDANAGDLFVDLGGAQARDLRLTLNAGSASVQTDGSTDLEGTLSVNAGSIELCTDPAVGLRFVVDANLTFSHNLDDEGLNRSGDSWTTDGFAAAEHTLDLRLSGNAASFTLNPEGGCS